MNHGLHSVLSIPSAPGMANSCHNIILPNKLRRVIQAENFMILYSGVSINDRGILSYSALLISTDPFIISDSYDYSRGPKNELLLVSVVPDKIIFFKKYIIYSQIEKH